MLSCPRLLVCRLGSEREACLQLLQKAYNMAERGTPLGIKSAICLDHLKGYFYVEAFRDAAVSIPTVISTAASQFALCEALVGQLQPSSLPLATDDPMYYTVNCFLIRCVSLQVVAGAGSAGWLCAAGNLSSSGGGILTGSSRHLPVIAGLNACDKCHFCHIKLFETHFTPTTPAVDYGAAGA
jgi:hypothetical protein